jgi:16S rRNA processing protein RimM
MTWESMVTVGRIVRSHGNRGHVVVFPETDFAADRFAPGASVDTLAPDGGLRTLQVVTSREHDGRWIVGFAGVESIDDAERLRGLELRIPAGEVKPLESGYYVHDLLGCDVETVTGVRIGRVTAVHLGSGPPLLAVDGKAGEVLVPLAQEICREVDVVAKRIVVTPIEGLVELNARGGGAGAA